MTNEVFIKFPNVSSNVSIARMAAAIFASHHGFSISGVEEIKVAVSEAVSNAVLHAYPGSLGSVEVVMRCIDKGMEIIVEDFGKGIEDLEQAKQAGFTSMPEHMGLGFTFMESFMDELFVESSPGKGTKLRMAKNSCH